MDVLPTSTVVDDRFRIKRLVGSGGYGQVYEAEQLSVKRVVALKVLRTVGTTKESTIERFTREARYACRLNHPNTVIYYDFGQDDAKDLMYLAMEFLNGQTLADRLNATVNLSIEETTEIVRQICGSLDESHAIGLIHRDIKPANIMLIQRAGRNNFVKLIDFGIAKLVAPILKFGGGQRLTGTGMMVGSPHYMSPEQIRGGATPVDARTDVYSVACLIYKMLVGVPPFNGPSAFDVATAQLTEAPPTLAELGASAGHGAWLPAVQRVLSKALEKDREQRQPSALSFLEEFEAAVAPAMERQARMAAQIAGDPEVSELGDNIDSQDDHDTPFAGTDMVVPKIVDPDTTVPRLDRPPLSRSDLEAQKRRIRHGQVPDPVTHQVDSDMIVLDDVEPDTREIDAHPKSVHAQVTVNTPKQRPSDVGLARVRTPGGSGAHTARPPDSGLHRVDRIPDSREAFPSFEMPLRPLPAGSKVPTDEDMEQNSASKTVPFHELQGSTTEMDSPEVTGSRFRYALLLGIPIVIVLLVIALVVIGLLSTQL